MSRQKRYSHPSKVWAPLQFLVFDMDKTIQSGAQGSISTTDQVHSESVSGFSVEGGSGELFCQRAGGESVKVEIYLTLRVHQEKTKAAERELVVQIPWPCCICIQLRGSCIHRCASKSCASVQELQIWQQGLDEGRAR